MPITPTNTKAARQPKCSPNAAATGTPTKVALVSPNMTQPTARARRPGGARAVAASAVTPKEVPCGKPASRRIALSDA